MGQLLLVLVVAGDRRALVFGVDVLVTGAIPGWCRPNRTGGAATAGQPLAAEADIGSFRFDTALRGYRMAQVDQVLRRAAYDIGYKTELIGVLEAEVAALREGRVPRPTSCAGPARARGGRRAEEPGTPAAVAVRRHARPVAAAAGCRRPEAAPPTAADRLATGRPEEAGRRSRYAGRARRRPAQPRGPERVTAVRTARRPGIGEVTATVIVDAPAARVFAALSDWERQWDWIPLTQVRVVEGDGGEGSRIEAVTASARPCCATRCGWTGSTPRTRSGWCTAAGAARAGRDALHADGARPHPGGLARVVPAARGAAGRFAWPVLWPGSKLSLTRALKRFARLVEQGRLP